MSEPTALRSWTVDANDGIIAAAGILEGFAGAGANQATLLLASTVAAIAGGLALGGAKWSELSTEREAQLRLVSEETAQLELSPEEEVLELASYYERKGLSPQLALQVAQQLTERDALAAQLESEHGIVEIMSRAVPALGGIAAGLSFMLGAAIPLVITALVPGNAEAWAILLAVVVSLTLTSIIVARSGGTAAWRMIVRTLGVGIGTLVVSFVVGSLVF
jgi:vacuolar iron transporter family protein